MRPTEARKLVSAAQQEIANLDFMIDTFEDDGDEVPEHLLAQRDNAWNKLETAQGVLTIAEGDGSEIQREPGLSWPRAEHLAWAKERALAYLPDDYSQAMASFISDLGKHRETRGHAVIELMGMCALAGRLNERECRDLIEGTR